MTIYHSSRKFRIDSNTQIELLSSSNIDAVQAEDILILTGTIRDDLIVKNLVDRKILPFIITFSTASSFSPLIQNLSLIVKRRISNIDNKLINQVQDIYNNIKNFESLSKEFLEEENNLNTLKSLALYQQMQFISSFYKGVYKSTDEVQTKRKDLYFASGHKGDKAFYVTLHNNDTLRVFKIAQELDKDEQDFIHNMFHRNFEVLMDGEKIELRNRKYSFNYEEITQRYNKDFLLMGIDEEHDFSSYGVYNIHTPKAVKNMKVYEVSNEIKMIDEKGKLALESLKNIIQAKENEYRNLDVFLFASKSFKSVISSLEYTEQENFKDIMISTMFEKIYENIKESDRKASLLRFALVSLLSDNFASFNLKTCSHIFYDIHNGININAQLIKSGSQKTDEINSQKKTLDDTTSIDESQEELLDAFLEKNQSQKFIQVFLKSILEMGSENTLNLKRTTQFFCMTSYLSTTENLKITYCFSNIVYLQSKPNKVHTFFLKLEDFIYLDSSITIDKYLKKEFEYACQENSQDIQMTMDRETFITKVNTLIKFRNKFMLELEIVGLFYKLISEQSTIDEIIVVSFSKMKNQELNIQKLCQNKITFAFLSLFFKGHGKKNCESNLKSFLDESRFLLEENYV